MRLFSLLFLFSFISFPQQSNLSKAVNSISEYIASDHFIQLQKQIGDLSATDSIYTFAIRYTENDRSEALLSLMLATVPYNKVPINIPIINSTLNYPLISADEETFLKKNENLPRNLFIDTPQNISGDQDKLAHFFGSAFLSYESAFFDLGELIGYFVEVFEESFSVQSKIDLRDLDVNNYGRFFGDMLNENPDLLPSQIIILRSMRFIKISI